MVIARRRGNTEQASRRGIVEENYERDYSRGETVAPARTIDADVSDVTEHENQSYYNNGRRSNIEDEALGVNYTYRTYSARETTAEPRKQVATNTARHSGEEVMPLIRRETDDYARTEVRSEKAPKSHASVKSKAALFSYLAAVIVLAVLVIVTGVAISTVNAQSDALEAQISVRNEQLFEQNATIAELTSSERIENAAIASGMEKIENPAEIELLSQVDTVKYEGRTNAFDKFCDWLSNFFGG